MTSQISNNATFFQRLIPESETIKNCFVAVRQASLRSSCCRRIDTPLEFMEAAGQVMLHGGANLMLAPLHLTKSLVHLEFCKGVSIFFDDLVNVSKCILLSALCIYVAAVSIFSPKKCVDFLFHPSYFADPAAVRLQSELRDLQLENLRLQQAATELRERICASDTSQVRQNLNFVRQVLEIETQKERAEEQRDAALLQNRELLLLNGQMSQANRELAERNEHILRQNGDLLLQHEGFETAHQRDMERIRSMVEANEALHQEGDKIAVKCGLLEQELSDANDLLEQALSDANDSLDLSEAQIKELQLENSNLVQTLNQLRNGIDTAQKTIVKRTSSFSPDQITKISLQLQNVKNLIQENEGHIFRAKIRRVNSNVGEVLQFFLKDPNSPKQMIYEFPIDEVDVPIREFFSFLGDAFVAEEKKADILEKFKPYKVG